MTPKCSITLSLETLDERVVPALVNLASSGASFVGNNTSFIARQSVLAPSQAQNLDTFVRIQGGPLGSEAGYNTTDRSPQFDTLRGARTHAIQLKDIPVVNVGGVAYREFILDINQRNLLPLLSVDSVRIFTSSQGNLDQYNQRTDTLRGAQEVFNLDARGDVSLILNSRLGRNGVGDMTLLVPSSNFGSNPNAFVYLYSEMGGVFGAWGNGGAESWSVRPVTPTSPPPPPPPSGGNSSISGFVYTDYYVDDQLTPDWNEELEGVTVQLLDANGNVIKTTTTNQFGMYTFTGLSAGTYSVREIQPTVDNMPSGFDDRVVDGYALAVNGNGTPGVTFDEFGDSYNNLITNISVNGTTSVTGYNFQETYQGD